MCKRIYLYLVLMILLVSPVSQGMQIASSNRQKIEITSNRHVLPDRELIPVESFLDTKGFQLISQSDVGELWLSTEYHTLRLVDRRTDFVWGAIPLEGARNLNRSWKSYGGSIVSVECYDQKNSERRYGLLNNAVVEYQLVENGFRLDANYENLGISFSARVTLNGNKLTFQLEEKSLIENGDYRLKSLAFMPYLGSVFGNEMEGWFLLPDGPGALMRFQQPGSYIAGYDQKIYGKDLAIDQLAEAQSLNSTRPDDYVIPSSQVLMPVYGIAHGIKQNALLSVIEGGEHYASIVATPAGLGNTKYNSIMTRFEYRQKYNRASNRSGAGALVPQDVINVLTPKQSFYLLSGEQASYDQMAVFYRDLLLDNRTLGSTTREVALRLEVIGANVKQLALWKVWQSFSTLGELQEMITELRQSGVGNLSVVLRDYTLRNLPGEALSSRVGSMQELSFLQTLLADGGGRLLLYLDPIRANEDQINQRLQAAHTMSTSPISMWRDNFDSMYPETFFYRPSLVERNTREHLARFARYDTAADQLGSLLFGDFTSGRERTRAETAPSFLSLAKELDENGFLAMYTPNQIMWPYTQAFFDLPLVNGQYLYETDTVPFLPIVLKGSIPLYAPPLNTGAFSRDRILRMIEYGANPSFILTAAESHELTDTPLEDLYSTCFDDWKEYILETEAYMRNALQNVAGLRITAHQAMDTGRVCVTYEGGLRILINYRDEQWESQSGVVGPHDYLVLEGSEDR